MSANCIFCVKFRKNRLYFLGYYAIIKIQQAESEESAMQTTRRLAVLTVLAAVLIAAGALFLIAPVWQPLRMSRRRYTLPRRRHRPSSTSTRPRRRN